MDKRKKGGIIALIGYILSPFSWYNDIFVNIPLAYAFGFIFGLIHEDLFVPMMIIGYWITNIVGIMMMHYGIANVVSKKDEKKCKYGKKDLMKDVLISIGYTLFIVILVIIEWLEFPL
jgi:hypothetical protein